MKSEIIREPSPLRRELWEFKLLPYWGGGLRIMIDRYAVQERKPPRHKWRTMNAVVTETAKQQAAE